MENQTREETRDLPPIAINEEIKNYLYETAKWGKILAIIAFVGIGFIIILGIFLGAGYSFMSGINAGLDRVPGASMGLAIFYIIIGLLYLFPTAYLYQFSNNIKQGIDHNSELQVTEAFGQLKSLFKFYGIYILVIAILYVLIMIMIIAGGLAFMNSMRR